MEHGIVDEPNTFIVATKNAGAGSLGLAIDGVFVVVFVQVLFIHYFISFLGPSEAEMDWADNKDGTATVEYTPTEEGDYAISVKFADEDIPGSPFMVREAFIKGTFFCHLDCLMRKKDPLFGKSSIIVFFVAVPIVFLYCS